jgi:3-carboxy-cis,cis-muconate cycloisomerase
MAISALDSRLFKNLFGTQEIRNVFNDKAHAQRMVDVEIALAKAQSKTGAIPADVGEKLAETLLSVQ